MTKPEFFTVRKVALLRVERLFCAHLRPFFCIWAFTNRNFSTINLFDREHSISSLIITFLFGYKFEKAFSPRLLVCSHPIAWPLYLAKIPILMADRINEKIGLTGLVLKHPICDGSGKTTPYHTMFGGMTLGCVLCYQ